jgi:hypothetical protein
MQAIIVLEQINPPITYAMPCKDIPAIHKAVGYGPCRPSATASVQNFGADATGGYQMHVALEINFALWGMIISAAMEAAQLFAAF